MKFDRRRTALTLSLASLAIGAPFAQAAGILALGAGKGDAPRVVVRINPGTTEFFPDVVSAQFFAFDESFKGGVTVAVGDFDADATLELATASGAGMTPTVKIWNLQANGELDLVNPLQESFSAPFAGIEGGLFVAAGDFDNSGKDSLVVTSGGGLCHVLIFDDFETVSPNDDKLGNSQIDNLLAYPVEFQHGCRPAMGITNPDNKEDLVLGNGSGNQTHLIRIFRDTDDDSMLSDEVLLDEFVPTLNGPYKGMFVAVGNVSEGTTNGEIVNYIVGGGNVTIRVNTDADNDGIFSEAAATEAFAWNSGNVKSKNGLRIAVANLDGDARPELCVTRKVVARPEIQLREAAAAAGSDVGVAALTTVPYVDSLITTYFKRTPYVAWSD